MKSVPLYLLGQNYQAMLNASLLSMISQNGNYISFNVVANNKMLSGHYIVE